MDGILGKAQQAHHGNAMKCRFCGKERRYRLPSAKKKGGKWKNVGKRAALPKTAGI